MFQTQYDADRLTASEQILDCLNTACCAVNSPGNGARVQPETISIFYTDPKAPKNVTEAKIASSDLADFIKKKFGA